MGFGNIKYCDAFRITRATLYFTGYLDNIILKEYIIKLFQALGTEIFIKRFIK